MTEGRASRLVLPAFTLTEVCSADDPDSRKRQLKVPNAKPVTYYYRPVQLSAGEQFNINNMHMVLNPDGSPWVEACLYLFSKVESTYDHKAVASSSNISSDLAAYRQFLAESDIDYLDFPTNKQQRPTYRYRAHLKAAIRSGEIALTTGQRFMQSVIGFYRWLASERGFKPENPMWNDSDRYIDFKDRHGFTRLKQVKTTSLAIPGKSSEDPSEAVILDGGRLKPLPMDQQLTLIRVLFDLGNFEMTLAHLLALFTGARIQTVLTLKVRHFRAALPDRLPEVRLGCGPGTGIDTKNDKRITIFIPRWLYEQIATYSASQRARSRRMKSPRGDVEDNYLFLSNRGTPYYEDSADQNTFNPDQTTKYRAAGGAVRTFIADHVLPAMKEKCGSDFSYHFHDLRASFGMNMSDALTESVEKGEMTLTQARNRLKELMCHESFGTTDKYLGYREHTQTIRLTQERYHEYLRSLSDAASNGFEGVLV